MYEHILTHLGFTTNELNSGSHPVYTPIDGQVIAHVHLNTAQETRTAIEDGYNTFKKWRQIPAPKRGELIRLFGEELRAHKNNLAQLVTLECGKTLEEGMGEVQEMIDICDFAVGLSRQLYGLTIASERPLHRMMETWHPIGVVGVISAFNFPVAVWAWNFCIAIVCGNSVLWKPSEKTPLTALACQKIFMNAAQKFGDCPDGLSQVMIGHADIGEILTTHPKIALLSATGSCKMGKTVAPMVAKRMGHSLLELGGNNAMIVCPSANLDLTIRGIIFSAVGTSGQRCTTLRRLIVHESIQTDLLNRIKTIYPKLTIGNPLIKGHLMGPLIDQSSFDAMQEALKNAQLHGQVFGGERILQDQYPDGYYVSPALVELPSQLDIMKQETFAPILYSVPYSSLDEAISMQNDVDQGLSSCIFTNDIREAETFLSSWGSDCGIANVNIGPSGAEIGGAFGGEKETGGGRESGSDAWKQYMRRATNTINFSSELPLSQGIEFEI